MPATRQLGLLWGGVALATVALAPMARRLAAALPAQKLRDDVPTLAELLRAEGYRTGAVLANNAYLDPRFGLDRGFDHYFHSPHGGEPEREMDMKATVDAAIAWLEARAEPQRPFFLFLYTKDVHTGPANAPRPAANARNADM